MHLNTLNVLLGASSFNCTLDMLLYSPSLCAPCAAWTYGVLCDSLKHACSRSVPQLYVQLFRIQHTPSVQEGHSGSVSLSCWLWHCEWLHVEL